MQQEIFILNEPVISPHFSKSFEFYFSLLQELTSAAPDSNLFSTGVEEAFESAVNAYTTRENREILWLEYLDYKERLIKQSSLQREDVKLLFEVAKRCLACMPSSRALPYQSSIYWDDYSFHNKVEFVRFCFIIIRHFIYAFFPYLHFSFILYLLR